MRVRVTDVDQLRYYLRSEDMPLEDLLRRLRREEPPSDKMRAGTAFHAVLENAAHGGELDAVEHDGFWFRFELDAEIALPDVKELLGRKEYLIDGYPVTLSGKVDAIHGLTVYDHKLTGRWDAESYADAFQWRAYLSMFGGQHFTYNVFVGREEARTGDWVIREYHPITFHRYDGLEEDVRRDLRIFVDFAREYLQTA